MDTKEMSEYEKKMLLYKKAMASVNLYNPAKTTTRSSNTFNKDTLKSYMERPYANEKNLRSLSRFLRNRSQVYKKIINDNATMIDTRYRQVIPNYDLVKKSKSGSASDEKIRKSYFETIKVLDTMNLPSEMLKVYLECWTCDVFFGAYYYFKDEGGIMIPLDPDYCKIIGLYPTGDFAFAFDMSYFTGKDEQLELYGEPFTTMYRQYQNDTVNMRWQQLPDQYSCCMKINLEDTGKDEQLELYGEPFTTMYRQYQNDTVNMRWQQLPDQYSCCMKINLEDYLSAIPPYINLFYSLIDLEDLKELNAIEAENNLYKLLYMVLPLFSNSSVPDDFAVDPETAVQYYMKIVNALPDNVASFLTPLDIQQIQFDPDQTGDVNKVENASKNILKTAGHIAMADPNGATAMSAALRADEDYAIASLLPQTQAWVNRMLSYILPNPSKVKFLSVTKYSRDTFKEGLIRDMNYGLPVAQTLGILNGFSEADMICLARINNLVGLPDLYTPLSTASTQSGADSSEGGRPKETLRTDDGERSEAKKEAAG